jgi:hypothetical protein
MNNSFSCLFRLLAFWKTFWKSIYRLDSLDNLIYELQFLFRGKMSSNM